MRKRRKISPVQRDLFILMYGYAINIKNRVPRGLKSIFCVLRYCDWLCITM